MTTEKSGYLNVNPELKAKYDKEMTSALDVLESFRRVTGLPPGAELSQDTEFMRTSTVAGDLWAFLRDKQERVRAGKGTWELTDDEKRRASFLSKRLATAMDYDYSRLSEASNDEKIREAFSAVATNFDFNVFSVAEVQRDHWFGLGLQHYIGQVGFAFGEIREALRLRNMGAEMESRSTDPLTLGNVAATRGHDYAATEADRALFGQAATVLFKQARMTEESAIMRLEGL